MSPQDATEGVRLQGEHVRLDPDFVILGAKRSDCGVMIVASDRLASANVDLFQEWPDELQRWSDVSPPRSVVHIHCHTQSGPETVMIVYASTYAEALRTLFAQWSPSRTQDEIEGGARQLRDGRRP